MTRFRPLAEHLLTRAARTAGFAGIALLSSIACAAELTFQSGPKQTALIELYTSEGCSSCPPAEKWLGALRTDPALWRAFVPVAFHVNYWDHLGWRDVLATRAFTQRQHTYAEAWRAQSVYTPGFVRNGVEWRPRGEAADRAGAADAGTLTLTWQADATCRIDYVPASTARGPADVEASLALLGGGIVSAVRSGENSGRTLSHEFVALRLETVRLRRDAEGKFSGSVPLALPTDRALPPFSRRAVAGWVTRAGTLTTLQAAGGWLTSE